MWHIGEPIVFECMSNRSEGKRFEKSRDVIAVTFESFTVGIKVGNVGLPAPAVMVKSWSNTVLSGNSEPISLKHKQISAY